MGLDFAAFAKAVETCGFFGPGGLENWCAARDLPTTDEALEKIAAGLMDAKLLTPFQANLLTDGGVDRVLYGEYLLVEPLGAGGMGHVYKAMHRRMRRFVALKVIALHQADDPDAVARFQREVAVIAQLSHPNIVTAHDAGEHKGQHFLVMEYVEGPDLSQLVKAGPLPLSKAVDYTIQAAHGLAHAHSLGIIHRDMKPSNLLVDRRGQVKVLDLGLARFEDQFMSGAIKGGLTATGLLVGTIDYMAPEQAENFRTASRASDIYSLGCTLFTLLTGRQPFEGESVVQKILAHREAPIPFLRSFRPDVPEELDQLFRQMLGKKPEDRPASMDQVIARLRAIALPPGSDVAPLLQMKPWENAATEMFPGSQPMPPAPVAADPARPDAVGQVPGAPAVPAIQGLFAAVPAATGEGFTGHGAPSAPALGAAPVSDVIATVVPAIPGLETAPKRGVPPVPNMVIRDGVTELHPAAARAQADGNPFQPAGTGSSGQAHPMVQSLYSGSVPSQNAAAGPAGQTWNGVQLGPDGTYRGSTVYTLGAVSLGLGIWSFVCPCTTTPLGIVAVIMGGIAAYLSHNDRKLIPDHMLSAKETQYYKRGYLFGLIGAGAGVAAFMIWKLTSFNFNFTSFKSGEAGVHPAVHYLMNL